MSALALEPRVARGSDRVGVQAAGVGGATDLGGEPTLDALVAGVWEGLAAHRSVGCPVCGEEMAPGVRSARAADRRRLPELRDEAELNPWQAGRSRGGRDRREGRAGVQPGRPRWRRRRAVRPARAATCGRR